MKISELCKMIEDTIHSGKYSSVDKKHKDFANSVMIINRSESEDLQYKDIKIEVRIQNLYTINNYVPNIPHLPGVIEIDILDSFKMLCRRLERLKDEPNKIISKNMTITSKNPNKDTSN
jgi:hypothetical protein